MLHEINSRSDVAEEKISESEDIIIGTFQNKTQKENRLKKVKQSSSNLWDNFKWPEIYVIGALEEESRKIARKLTTKNLNMYAIIL